MASPIGNDFWKLRLRHGNKPKIEEPETFVEKAIEYFQNLEENQLSEIDFRGKDATEVSLPKVRIPTKDDFALFCGFCEWKSIEDYKSRSEDFAQVVTRVEKAIQTSQLQYASAGFAKENIISRLLGLADRQQIDIPKKIKVKFNSPDSEDGD